ncbi:MAG: four helix bundle protein [Patescibacteria group bacterium]|mgnify:FL=1
MKNQELKSFKDLLVWQKSADLAVLIYSFTDKFPKSETYGIVNQMRRAAISISSNLAEGFKRRHSGFTIVELMVAMGLFLILMGIATGGFVKAMRTQRAIVGLMEANDNANLVLEQMAREIRTGYNFTGKDADADLKFVNQKNIVVWYRLNNSAIERASKNEIAGVLTANDYKKITADNVKVANFNIILFGNNVGDGYSPRITIGLSVGSTDKYLENILTNIQTTISARVLDS